MTTLRETIEDVVRGFLRSETATAQPMRVEPKPEPHTRHAAFVALAALQARQKALAPLRAEAADLTKELEENAAQAAAIRQKLGDVEGEIFVKNLNLSTEIDRRLAIVRETAPLAINGFIAEMHLELDRLASVKVDIEEQLGEKNYDRELPTRPKFTYSTAPSIQRRVAGVRQVIQRAEEMKNLDLSDQALTEGLGVLRDTLPAIAAPEKVRV
jgi:hypothetical protein